MSDRTTILDELLASIGSERLVRPVAAGPAINRFPDGRRYHVEIPSVETPEALTAVLDEASRRGIRVDRVSQGSGVSLLLDAELREMAAMARESEVELVLWCGLRCSWDISAMARSSSGSVAAAAVRGRLGLEAALDESLRAAQAGVSGVLVADVGVLTMLGEAKHMGVLPESFVLKTSLALPCANPATARSYVAAGATSLNLPTDLPLAEIGAIREKVTVALDCYVEGADDFGAPLRYHEIAQLVEVASPVHLKFGLRNARSIYPAGAHLASEVIGSARERVRRAAIGLETLDRAHVAH